jgi:hypothetical protein
MYIGFKVTGLAIVDQTILEFDLELPQHNFKLGTDEFDSIFLRNTGLQYVYTREFQLSSPVITNISSKPALNKLYDYICNLHNNLEHALRILRLSDNSLEVLTLIRQPLDQTRASIAIIKKCG